MLHKPRYEDASHLTVDWKQLVSFGSLLIRVVYAACGIPSRCHNICFALPERMYPHRRRYLRRRPGRRTAPQDYGLFQRSHCIDFVFPQAE